LVLEYAESPSASLSRRLVGMGKLDEARAILVRMDEKAAMRGDDRSRSQIAGSLARLEWFAGNWRLAIDRVALAVELTTLALSRHHRAFTGRLRALAEADLGLVEEARTSATEAMETAEAMGDQEWRALALGVLGRLELALGNVEAAANYLRDPPEELLSRGYRDPAAPLWGDAIEALIAADELERARRYLESYEESAERAESPWGTAVG